jgi:hypothetical protein
VLAVKIQSFEYSKFERTFSWRTRTAGSRFGENQHIQDAALAAAGRRKPLPRALHVKLQPDGPPPRHGSPLMRAARSPTLRGSGRAGNPCGKVKEGETENDIFAFLTTEPNADVKPIHLKLMPEILTSADEIETWMTAPAKIAIELQRPLPDEALRIVARGKKQDGPEQ